MLSDEQIVELQTRIAFQEDSLTALNDVITRQQSQIDALERELRLHREKLIDMMDQLTERGAATVTTDERPPHY